MPHDPAERFTHRVESYVRGRPDYPQSLYDFLERELGVGPGCEVAELGAGTGIFTRGLLDLGATVHAVEPNESMRAAAEAFLGDREGFHSVDGRAEDTTLDDGAVDLVVAAQAAHWFDAGSARGEMLRVLRPEGRAVLVWNQRRPTGGAFHEDYEALLLRWGTDYERVRASWDTEATLLAVFGRDGWSRATFQHGQTLDRDGLRARVDSSSYMPGPDHPDRDAMMEAFGALWDAHARDGRVALEYDCEVYWGRPAGSPP